MPAGDIPFTTPRWRLGAVAIFAIERHRTNRSDRGPNPGFLPTALQGEAQSVEVRLVWDLRVLRVNGLDDIRSNRAQTGPYPGPYNGYENGI